MNRFVLGIVAVGTALCCCWMDSRACEPAACDEGPYPTMCIYRAVLNTACEELGEPVEKCGCDPETNFCTVADYTTGLGTGQFVEMDFGRPEGWCKDIECGECFELRTKLCRATLSCLNSRMERYPCEPGEYDDCLYRQTYAAPGTGWWCTEPWAECCSDAQ
jgi:hypothetical protein